MICRRCDGIRIPVYSPEEGWQAHCPKCGEIAPCAAIDGLEAAAEAAGEGCNFYAVQEFDEAKRCFERAAELSGGRVAYRWAALLAEYGVKYCASESAQSGYAVNYWKRELPSEPLAESAAYRELYRAAAKNVKLLRALQREAGEISEGLAQIEKLAASGERWDVFFSFKDMDAEGKKTLERQLLDNLYTELASEGLKVFFAPRSMLGRMIDDFEGYIYTALKTAKLMVLVGSSKENVNAPWVASEWERFWRWGKRGQIVLCPVGGMRMSGFPREITKVQTPLAGGVESSRVGDPIVAKWIAGEIQKLYASLRRDEPRSEAAQPRDELSLLRQRAQRGDDQAQFQLGGRYFLGRGVKEDFAEALKWIRLSAE